MDELAEHRAPPIDDLLEALRDPDPQVAAGAAHALVQLGDVRAVEPLLRRLDQREPLAVQFAALHALPRLGGAAVADSLIAVARDETRDPGVRRAAESELVALGVEPGERRVGVVPVWMLGLVGVGGAVVAAAVTGASALMLIAVAGVLIAGANAGLRAKRSR